MKSRVLLIILLILFTVPAILFFIGCDEAQNDGIVTINLSGASAAEGQSLYAFLYAENESDINNVEKCLAVNSAVISSGSASFVLEVNNGEWEGSGTNWLGTASTVYDLYIYTDGNDDGDNDPATRSGDPVPKAASSFPDTVTIAGDQTVSIVYTDMVDYEFVPQDGTVTVNLSGASSADGQTFSAYLYAAGEVDLNNAGKILAAKQAVISSGSAGFTLETAVNGSPNGTVWVGTASTSYDVYIYTDANADGDYEPATSSGSPVPQMTNPFPSVLTVDGDQTVSVDYSSMTAYDFGGTVTVTLTNASAADTQVCYAYLYAEDETDYNNAAALIATNTGTISSGTVSFVLEKSDGNWGGTGDSWVGVEGESYDLYVYTDGNDDNDYDPATSSGSPVPKMTVPYPTVVTTSDDVVYSVDYTTMVNYSF